MPPALCPPQASPPARLWPPGPRRWWHVCVESKRKHKRREVGSSISRHVARSANPQPFPRSCPGLGIRRARLYNPQALMPPPTPGGLIPVARAIFFLRHSEKNSPAKYEKAQSGPIIRFQASANMGSANRRTTVSTVTPLSDPF